MIICIEAPEKLFLIDVLFYMELLNDLMVNRHLVIAEDDSLRDCEASLVEIEPSMDFNLLEA